jgi:DNA repair exonuclease SbcCD ATPase subunit
MSAVSDADQAALDHVADALYALKPDDFAAARDAEVRAARQNGNPALAREIGKLRKPTQSAWLVNLLWRDQQAVMEQLFELAQELTRAQADAAGAALRELMTQRRQLENALLRRAVELGAEAGVRVSDSVAREAQETLSAALAQPDIADEVRSGHLVKAASYAGFGGGVSATPASPRPAQSPIDLDAARQRRADSHAASVAEPPGETKADHEEQRRAAEEAERRAAEEAERQRRAQAERQLAQARRDAEWAAARRADAAKAAEAAHSRVGDLRQRLDTLRQQLQRLESEVEAAEASASEADSDRAQAEHHDAEAQQSLHEAQAALTE